MISKEMVLGSLDYYKTHLSIVNSIFPVKMTRREIEVLANFMDVSKNDPSDEIINPVSRKEVKDRLGINTAALYHFIASLIEKGFLERTSTGFVKLKDFIIPNDNEESYSFKIKKYETKENVSE